MSSLKRLLQKNAGPVATDFFKLGFLLTVIFYLCFFAFALWYNLDKIVSNS